MRSAKVHLHGGTPQKSSFFVSSSRMKMSLGRLTISHCEHSVIHHSVLAGFFVFMEVKF